MKYSIRTKFFLATGATVLIFSVILTLAHIVFYEDYAKYQNEKQLREAYEMINAEIEQEGDAYDSYLPRIEYSLGVSILIFPPEFQYAKYGPLPSNLNDYEMQEYLFRNYIKYFIQYEMEIHNEGYQHFQSTAATTDFTYLYLFGILDNDDYIVIRTPITAIAANIEYSRFFILIAGMVTLFLSLVVAYYISGRFSKPLIEINTITNRMTQLDFSRKYKGKMTDEIGELGCNINCLSDQMESTIKQLKMSNSRLEEEVKKSRQIDEMRQNLLANVSHDLKTPLAIIQGYAEGLKENISENQEDREFYCNVIIEEAERMNKLVRQILNLSKLELGTTKPEKENIEIHAFIDAMYEKFNLIFKEKGIRAINDVFETIVVADVDMLGQVLVNLLTNAADHTPPNGAIITNSEYHDNKIRIYVYNDGELLDEDEFDKIWLSFYKVDKARTRAYGGTGLGLTSVKTIIEAHNNRCGVENRENGVAFWIELDIG